MADILGLWEVGVPEGIGNLIEQAPFLDVTEKSDLSLHVAIYLEEEGRREKDLYHAHGIASLGTFLYSVREWNRNGGFPEFIDGSIPLFVGALAVLYHDFRAIVDIAANCAILTPECIKALCRIIQAGYLEDEEWYVMTELAKSTNYTETAENPQPKITWGKEPFSDRLSDVKIAPDCTLAELLVAYSDLVGQLASPSYHSRRRELLEHIGRTDEKYIPIKILYLTDMVVRCLAERFGLSVPRALLLRYLENVRESREFYVERGYTELALP